MSKIFRIALAQINPIVGDITTNTSMILDYVQRAQKLNVDLVAFPELAITGYPPEDLLFKKSFIQANVAAMNSIVEASEDVAVVVGYVEQDGIDLFNSAALGYRGRYIDSYRKIFLPNYGVFDEERYFKKGDVCPVYEINGTQVGINICEDIWYPMGPTVLQCGAGAEVIVNINASPFHAGKRIEREAMLSDRSSTHQVFLGYANTVGGQDELVFDGSSVVVDSDGHIITRGISFDEDLIVADLDMGVYSGRNPENQSRNPITSSDFGEARNVFVSSFAPNSKAELSILRDVSELSEMEEVYHALVMGTGDYVRKSGFTKAVIGLSGGIDSALTCVIAVDALGCDNVVGVGMPSRYSSDGSIIDAKELADNLGIDFWEIPIEPAHVSFTNMLEPMFKDTNPNVAEENVQARIRGNVMMTIANKFGWIVLTTGNKSEMAMGYATLYGDMAGGFAVLKDVPKTLVYDLSRQRNQQADDGLLIPLSTIEKPPSAELRPDQTDQDTLPPYDELDPIVKAYVEEDFSYLELVDAGYPESVVQKVIAAVDRNEYKRRQSPPGVKITPRAFGKDRRLPIINKYSQF
ncbi:MAG: NAD+ synthase [Dehalococcoidia bacterium]|nr:MAG: NAD+ synthase [Dehalococcoidia bacterium]